MDIHPAAVLPTSLGGDAINPLVPPDRVDMSKFPYDGPCAPCAPCAPLVPEDPFADLSPVCIAVQLKSNVGLPEIEYALNVNPEEVWL